MLAHVSTDQYDTLLGSRGTLALSLTYCQRMSAEPMRAGDWCVCSCIDGTVRTLGQNRDYWRGALTGATGGQGIMQEAGTLTGEAAPIGGPAAFREKAWASLASTGGILLVLGAYWALETYGPSSRVVFYDYLPFQGAWECVLAATLGAWLGAWGFRLFQPGRHYSIIRLMVGCLLGATLGLIAGALLVLPSNTTTIHPIVLLVIAAIVPCVGAWWFGISCSDRRRRQGAVGLIGSR